MWFKKIFAALTKKERITFVLALAGTVVSFAIVMGFVIAADHEGRPCRGRRVHGRHARPAGIYQPGHRVIADGP